MTRPAPAGETEGIVSPLSVRCTGFPPLGDSLGPVLGTVSQAWSSVRDLLHPHLPVVVAFPGHRAREIAPPWLWRWPARLAGPNTAAHSGTDQGREGGEGRAVERRPRTEPVRPGWTAWA